MAVAIITGSAGLIGSEASAFFSGLGFDVVGIDNNMRSVFFGEDASTDWQRHRLERELAPRYQHLNTDIRDLEARLRRRLQTDVSISLTAPNKGFIKVAFYSAEDLERLTALMGLKDNPQ